MCRWGRRTGEAHGTGGDRRAAAAFRLRAGRSLRGGRGVTAPAGGERRGSRGALEREHQEGGRRGAGRWGEEGLSCACPAPPALPSLRFSPELVGGAEDATRAGNVPELRRRRLTDGARRRGEERGGLGRPPRLGEPLRRGAGSGAGRRGPGSAPRGLARRDGAAPARLPAAPSRHGAGRGLPPFCALRWLRAGGAAPCHRVYTLTLGKPGQPWIVHLL